MNLLPPEFVAVLRLLVTGKVDFVLIGGLAATLHGSARVTYDVDVVYGRSPGNISRLCTALASVHPYLRGAPPGLPFKLDEKTVERGLNFTLDTDLGALDLLGEATGGGVYERLATSALTEDVTGLNMKYISLEMLIHLKRSAGRVKDFETIAELESLRLDRDRLTDPPRNSTTP